MKTVPIKRAPTLFLKAVIIVIGIIVLIFCGFMFPTIFRELTNVPRLGAVVYPAMFGVFLSPIPFTIALYQGFMLLQYIDTNNAFSDLSIHALKNITYSAVAMSILYAFALPLTYLVAELDDAPGLIPISTAFAAAPLVVATFAAVLQKLVQNAVDMKGEIDLTV